MRGLLRHIAVTVAAAAVTAGVSLLTGACNSSGCTDNHSAIPLAEFYGSNMRTVSMDSLQIHGIGAPGDSLLLAAGTIAGQVYLPMRSTMPNTTWCFSYKWKRLDYPQLNDTVSLDYTSIPYLTTDDCGAMYRYRLTRVRYTQHLIDSVGVVDSLITNANVPSIHIYFRTAEEEENTAYFRIAEAGQNTALK